MTFALVDEVSGSEFGDKQLDRRKWKLLIVFLTTAKLLMKGFSSELQQMKGIQKSFLNPLLTVLKTAADPSQLPGEPLFC